MKKPLIETIINLIKKLKSSKSYWSLSYLILLFTLREAISWKYGEIIQKFCEVQATNSSYPFLWEALSFIFSAGGSIELVILGIFLFVVLSLVKFFESKNDIDTKKAIEHESKELQVITTQEANKTRDHINQIKDDLLKEFKVFGNKEEFLKAYFGDDWEEALKNTQTYHNLKSKIEQHTGNIEALLEEKEKLQKKIESRRLHSNGVQKMIDKALKELRFYDVLDLLDTFIDNNKELEEDLLNAHYQKALAYMEKIEYHKAKEEFEKYIPSGIEDMYVLSDYGIMYYTLGEYDKAIEFYNKDLKIALATLEKNHLSIAYTSNNLGVAWSDKGEYDKAIEFYNKSLEIYFATLGKNDPSIATTYGNLGVVWSKKGEHDKAINFHEKDLEITIISLGKNHPSTAYTCNNLGVAWSDKGEYDKAIEFYNESLKIYLTTIGETHPSTALTYKNLGNLSYFKGEYDEAIKFYNKDLKINLATLGEEHPSTADTYNNLGTVWSDRLYSR